MIGGSGLDAFYPIAPDAVWLERLVVLGVKTVQLRLKNASGELVRRQIEDALDTCREHGAQLIVNDFWQAAIAAGADYVHLGQEDLAGTDLAAIRAARVRLGISTHSVEELERALAAQPSYVALGPIYPTRLKVMPWAPQGLERVREWKARIGSLPLVAIGGITPERASEVRAAGAESVAVITDIFADPQPEERVRSWLAWRERELQARADR